MNFLFVLAALLFLSIERETAMSMMNEENEFTADEWNNFALDGDDMTDINSNINSYDDNMAANEVDEDYLNDEDQQEFEIAKSILERIKRKTELLQSQLYNRYNEMNQNNYYSEINDE